MSKRAFIIAFSTFAVLIVALFIADRNIERTLRVDGDRVIYTDAKELAKMVDLVVLATATGNSENIRYTVDGFPEGYTLSEIHISEILENRNGVELSDTITVVEPTYLFRNGIELGETRYTIEGYTPLVKSAEYILFLEWNEYRGVYEIYSADQGKVNTDNKDTFEIQTVSEENHLDILHRSVKSLYLQ
ncbi:hypothetical protein PA598K_01718 [Paenibacillus sp. 598K]|uniref:hypothetical protein n=1 Tax=Paenibacillus sp. 598K TaxID=1117987 RepID=UPI000FF91298|nr:hypothetical protein [Paenibacillus sp. 598K]GBF73429.1 hypothetical protein PA598K_01718 [Paenibacillus sp. 598K]